MDGGNDISFAVVVAVFVVTGRVSVELVMYVVDGGDEDVVDLVSRSCAVVGVVVDEEDVVVVVVTGGVIVELVMYVVGGGDEDVDDLVRRSCAVVGVVVDEKDVVVVVAGGDSISTVEELVIIAEGSMYPVVVDSKAVLCSVASNVVFIVASMKA